MAKTGPQQYPGASQAYRYQGVYGGDSMESNVVVWHTTEGTSLPSYGGGAEAPNFTAKPDFATMRLVWYQHFDFDTSSRALVNRAGGVETNTLNVCQVELVGTCDPAAHKKWSAAHLYTPELPDWVIRDLGAFAKWAHDQHGVPLTSGPPFRAYPSSYGATAVRMTGAQWLAFKGHCGHQHVPENDHGDPGAFPIAAVLAAAKGATPPSKEDNSMATTPDAVWKADVIPASAPPYANADYAKNRTWTASYALGSAVLTGRRTEAKVTALAKQLAAQTAAIKTLAGLVGKGVDTAAVVDAVEAAATTAVERTIQDAVIDVNINTPEA
ncbi:hypothetical protein [Streptomyces sp. NPDC048445]|uniref:hypothetical protein n=1 Tax=Streptomyces sp. NPDC048445 TaxID=3365553 RepID=UPI0037149325